MLRSIIELLWGTQPVHALQTFFGAGWSWFFHAVTLFGAHEAVALVVAVALWISGRRLAYAVLGIVALVMITNLLLWQVIALPRPSGPDIVVRGTSPVSSFPSGHTVVATVVWGLLALFGRIPKAAAVAIVLLVMLSRLYLGLHYLGDVLGGAVIGSAIVVLYYRAWPAITRRLAAWPFWAFMALGLAMPLAVLPFTVILASPRVWVAFGAALGAGLALPLEYRYVCYTPAGAGRAWQAIKVMIGLGVAAVLLFGRGGIGLGSPIFDAMIFTLAALWLALGAPALFAWLGWSRRAAPSR